MSKYHSHKVRTNDGVFDSKKELRRWEQLLELQKKGDIADLQRQVAFELIPRQTEDGKVIERAVKYFADFTYIQDGQLVVEDVKSAITKKKPEYILKRKLLLYRHNIKIKEV